MSCWFLITLQLDKYKNMISIIVAIANNNAIGRGNRLLAYLPKDLKWFKKNTTGKTIVMGRKTFESLPNGALPNRKNVVLSQNVDFKADKCIIVNNFVDIWQHLDNQQENFVIGGAEIYKLFLPKAEKLYITKIYANFPDADVFFPEINFDEWELLETIENKVDEKHKYNFDFLIYERE